MYRAKELTETSYKIKLPKSKYDIRVIIKLVLKKRFAKEKKRDTLKKKAPLRKSID
jgi:hypothetical protein